MVLVLTWLLLHHREIRSINGNAVWASRVQKEILLTPQICAPDYPVSVTHWRCIVGYRSHSISPAFIAVMLNGFCELITNEPNVR